MGDTIYKCIKCDYTETRKAGMLYPAIVPSHCGLAMQVVNGAEQNVNEEKSVVQEKRLPSAQSIRAMIQQLKGGVDDEEQETIEELLNGARQRVLAVIPLEALAILQQVSPVVLEVYALLHQPIEVQRKSVGAEGDQIEQANGSHSQSVPLINQASQSNQPGPTPVAFVELSLPQPVNSSPHIERGTLLYTPPPLTNIMTLDSFQGAYKGEATVSQGRGKKAKTTTQVVAVHKAIFEDELSKVGNAVHDPAYWLPKHNAMTVYFPGAQYEVEIAWLLGDYDPQYTSVPAGVNPTPEQIVQWMDDGIDEERWEIEVIKRHLRTSEQKAWFDKNDLTISDLLSGRCPVGLDDDWIFDDWNAKLGVKVFGF